MNKTKYVARDEYLQFLIQSMNKPIIKVVSGIRRSGKSTLCYLFREYLKQNGVLPEQMVTINLEDFSADELLDPKKLHQYLLDHLVDGKMTYIFLDEIQNVPNFERVVDSLFIRENVDLYITGSNAYFLSGELATMLSGRYIELKMLPLSFKEFAAWHEQNQIELSTAALFDKYLKSSFPFTLFTDTERERLDYLQGIFSTVVLNDIVKRLNVQDVRSLERLLEVLFSSIGSPVTINKIKDTMVSKGIKITNKTVDRYLQGIVDSMIMYEARRYDIHGRQLLDTQAKYYVSDLGLRNLVLRDHLEDIGHIIENVVYLELLRRGNKVYVGQSSKYEVDFVAIDVEQNIKYYQVAFSTLDSDVLKRELRSLERIDDHYPKYLITMDEIQRTANYNGIQKINLLDWLLEE
ncbi:MULTISPECIES: ATP-binding protein [Lactococcus]|uniref:ATP-binding protein n=1 Tax=Lactococcus TaxID=1357 RepID=UPI000310DC13|nr:MULTISPECIES: ATP-binding protein [Lactococcus]AJA56192.1 ATPase [Lactococcus lactis subsp. lactis]WBM77740.1 ATP-binding protein [Lactococcus lactis]WSP32200.1 ATP-binding protein [Lactococcus lactis subsp. lactis]